MSCRKINIPGGGTAIICNRGHRKMCYRCPRYCTKLCDYPKKGKTKGGKPITCDVAMCDEHAKGGKTPGVDFCEPHYDLAKAAHERRQKQKQ